MKRINKLLRFLPAVLVLALSAPAFAGDSAIGPNIPEAVKGDKCVEDTAVMRRNHMDYLKNHRDETMHEGIRTKKYSLKECLDCHATPDGESEPAANGGRGEGGHFCMNCHAYAGVHIDCFECHNTKPVSTSQFHPLVTPAMKAMKNIHQPDSAAMLNKMAGLNNKTGSANE